jgi:hypothetical protein
MPSPDVKMRADARLADAALALGLADPRPPLRNRLRELKDAHPAAFERALRHYDEAVLPELADGADPLAAWADWTRSLAELTSPGRLLAIDATGRAAPFAAPTPGTMVLFVPDDAAAGVLVGLAPTEPSSAQQATVQLLVERRLAL